VIQGGYSMGAGLNPPAWISCLTHSGGGIPNGTYLYSVASVDYRGGASVIQPTPSLACTTTKGNNTETVTWSAATGAVSYMLYRCNNASRNCTNSNGQIAGAAGTWYQVASGISGTTYNDTSASTRGNTYPIATAGMVSGLDNTGFWGPQFVGIPTTVVQLPAASSSAGIMRVVNDSTPVTSEGQTCTGGSTNTALAFSNGSVWKCF